MTRAHERLLQVEYRPIEGLIPYARNARTHSDGQVAQIAASIREFGWTNPVLLDGDKGIIAGHGRVLAARKLGLTEVPCIELAWLSEAQKRAYVVADNKLALNAGWDEELLALELADLRDLSVDLATIGFSEGELQSLLRRMEHPTEGLTDPDDVPETPKAKDVWVQPGDLFLLGDQRILCGDSTNSEDVARLLGGAKAVLLATDPPYLVDYTADAKNHPLSTGTRAEHGWDEYHGPETSVEFYAGFLRLALEHLKPRAAVYQWHAARRQALVEAA